MNTAAAVVIVIVVVVVGVIVVAGGVVLSAGRGLLVAPALFIELLDGLQLLLFLHAAVLKPNLDLALRQAQHVRQLDAPASGEVAVELELFLQLERLEPRVRLPTATPLVRVGA